MNRALILAAALAALSPATVGAQTRTIAEAGGWRAFSGTTDAGEPTCGMDVASTDDRRFLIQHYGTEPHLTVRAYRQSWRIPEATRIPVRAQIGAQAWTATAIGAGREVRWLIDRTTMDQWERAFRLGAQLTVTFQGGGTEAPWRISLTGSNAISNAFVACLRAVAQAYRAPSQPNHGPAAPAPAAPAVITPRGPERRA